MSAEKRKGDAFERDVVRVLNEHGHRYAERALQLGRHDDRGDVTGVPGFYFECKNHARFQLGVWIDEACWQAMSLGDGSLVPVLIVKRPGKSAEHAYAVVELTTFAEMINGRDHT